MQLGMLATLLNVTMTAVVRYSSLTSWLSYSESTYKKIGLFAWILAAVFTIPIFLFADVFIVGEVDDTASQVCRIRWSRIDRNTCKSIVLDSFSDCNVKSESCRQQQPNERVYYLIVLFLGVILPIGVSYLANIGVVRQLIS
ncbi:unnamed protein product [Oikopleura dioica]|uniref:G-protein coupled receptors family 1 profile domain-containing protein n=1 Tax=Oikopleura dioica TaxID=34765 RepID=E4XE75_OIKDI|nr:unnamed protein product [Oikopleura dioica]